MYHIYWSLWKQFSWKKSLLVIRKIGLFVKALASDDKYSLLNRDNLLQHLQRQLSEKEKTFLNLFCISQIWIVFLRFWKKDDSHSWWKKKWLDKCLKSPVSEDPQTSNMVNGLKHCINLNGSTLIYLLITLKAIQLQKVSLGDMINLRTVC